MLSEFEDKLNKLTEISTSVGELGDWFDAFNKCIESSALVGELNNKLKELQDDNFKDHNLASSDELNTLHHNLDELKKAFFSVNELKQQEIDQEISSKLNKAHSLISNTQHFNTPTFTTFKQELDELKSEIELLIKQY